VFVSSTLDGQVSHIHGPSLGPTSIRTAHAVIPHDIPPAHRASNCTTVHQPGSGVHTLAQSPIGRDLTWLLFCGLHQCGEEAIGPDSVLDML
jgi:hypothetical protein